MMPSSMTRLVEAISRLAREFAPFLLNTDESTPAAHSQHADARGDDHLHPAHYRVRAVSPLSPQDGTFRVCCRPERSQFKSHGLPATGACPLKRAGQSRLL